MAIVSCPKLWVGSEIAEFMDLARQYRRGMGPVSGGVLDQTQSFIEAVRFYESERGSCEPADPFEESAG